MDNSYFSDFESGVENRHCFTKNNEKNNKSRGRRKNRATKSTTIWTTLTLVTLRVE